MSNGHTSPSLAIIWPSLWRQHSESSIMIASMPPQHSYFFALLQEQLQTSHELDQQINTYNASGTLLEIPSTGKMVSSAYEQLRRAAEYSEEHLLLERAIKRFFRRNLLVAPRKQDDLGTELIVDLAQAGYLEGGQFSRATAERLNTLVTSYMAARGRLHNAHITPDIADSWILALLSTEAENQLRPQNVKLAALTIAYQHFLHTIPRDGITDFQDAGDYELCLYIAVHQAVLKSDIDIIRSDLHRISRQTTQDTEGFIRFNILVDRLFGSPLTHMLKRTVSRHAAPFRVLKSLTESQTDTAALLADKKEFLGAYDRQIDHEYGQLSTRLRRGITRSVIFLIITKVLIGVAVEIPYDLLVHGYVAAVPLAVNLLFPPLYMASLMLTLKMPSSSNKNSIHNYIEQLLYGDGRMEIPLPKKRRIRFRTKLLYATAFAIPVAATVFILRAIGFNLVQMAIFFTFFSTASFLGFRLSTLVRDLELSPRQAGLFASFQDFFYLPFVASGQWLSRKYSRLNLVARFMDVAIELPLKSILRLLRQWMKFVREKQDELY